MEKHHILKELTEHFPFSIFFTAAGVVVAALLTYGSIITGVYEPTSADHVHGDADIHMSSDVHAPQDDHAEPEHEHLREHTPHEVASHGENERFLLASRMLFHVLHPIHLLLSAMATTAMFCRYDRRLWRAIIVGFIGAVGVCGLSDIFMPYLAGRWLALKHMHFHWCLIEHPQMVLPFVLLGILSGLLAATAVSKSTVFSHSAHVFVSCAASLFYLICFGVQDWFSADKLPYVFAIVVLCVTIPCCLSDILFPLLIAAPEAREHAHCHHSH